VQGVGSRVQGSGSPRGADQTPPPPLGTSFIRNTHLLGRPPLSRNYCVCCSRLSPFLSLSLSPFLLSLPLSLSLSLSPPFEPQQRATIHVERMSVQGYLAHKKQRAPLGLP